VYNLHINEIEITIDELKQWKLIFFYCIVYLHVYANIANILHLYLMTYGVLKTLYSNVNLTFFFFFKNMNLIQL